MKYLKKKDSKDNMMKSKIVKISFIGLIIIICLLSNGFAQSVVEDSTAIKPISISQIATVAAEDYQQILTTLEKKVQIEKIIDTRPEIDTLKIETAALSNLSENLLQNQITNQYYRSLTLRWQRLENSIREPISTMEAYSASLEETLKDYGNVTQKWKITLDNMDEQDLSDDLNRRISGVILFIDSTRSIVKDSLAVSVVLLNEATDLLITSTEYIKRLEELRQLELSNLAFEKEYPIWNLKTVSDSLTSKADQQIIMQFGVEDSKNFLQKEWKTLIALVIAYILLLLLISWLQKIHKHDQVHDDPNASIRIYILSRPATTAFMLTLLLSLWWLPERPALLNQIYMVIFLIPFLLLYKGLVIKEFRWGIYLLVIVFLFWISLNFYHLSAVARVFISLLESIALSAILIWMMKISKKADSKFSANKFLLKIFTKGGPVLLFGTIIAFFSTIFGYTNFGSLLNSTVLSSLMIGLLLGLAFLCIITLIYFFIQTSYAEKSLIVKQKKMNLFNWLRKILRLTAIFLWIYYTLRLIYLWRPVSLALESLWQAGFQFGNFNLTLGGIFSFVLIIYLSWLVSYVIRLLLEVEIFGRFDMPRGVPMAISSLTQYFLILLGFMLAMSKLGFDLKNLSLLAGALGVGIGFGLQNTVNNFISGLILVFERPVTVGDIVNVAGHEGEVKKIGIRSSTIKQWDGSEVIVPNADLISQKVINWTLAKYTRRIILTIHTHVDTDPDQVLLLMTEAAGKVKYVLKDPEAKAYFHGMIDKHLEFALFYWASGNILDCKSQVNLEVQKSLKASGIRFQMPIPVSIEDSKLPIRES